MFSGPPTGDDEETGGINLDSTYTYKILFRKHIHLLN